MIPSWYALQLTQKNCGCFNLYGFHLCISQTTVSIEIEFHYFYLMGDRSKEFWKQKSDALNHKAQVRDSHKMFEADWIALE